MGDRASLDGSVCKALMHESKDEARLGSKRISHISDQRSLSHDTSD